MPFRPDPSGFQGGQARPGVDLVKSGEEEDVEGVVEERMVRRARFEVRATAAA